MVEYAVELTAAMQRTQEGVAAVMESLIAELRRTNKIDWCVPPHGCRRTTHLACRCQGVRGRGAVSSCVSQLG